MNLLYCAKTKMLVLAGEECGLNLVLWACLCVHALHVSHESNLRCFCRLYFKTQSNGNGVLNMFVWHFSYDGEQRHVETFAGAGAEI